MTSRTSSEADPDNSGGAPLSRATIAAFALDFWQQPPRAHGDVIGDREVSFLELFYDLAYVVVISQAAHHFSGDVTWAGAGRFAIVFGLIRLAWINGAVYHDLHGRSEGRTRTYVFLQMGLLALLAVFTGDATFGSGPYIVGVVGSAMLVGASALLPPGLRLTLWAFVIVVWIAGIAVLDWRGGALRDTSLGAGSSMIERFDLFAIIVLGEVIVGVVTGIAAADRSPAAVVTGVLGLGIGFACWWSYFDLVAARRLASRRGALATWVLGHFPVTLTIAASGAVMVSMIDHADTEHAPYPASLLLSSSVAVGILALILIATSLADWRDPAPVYRPVSWALGTAAAGALLLGWLAPPPGCTSCC